ncbi:unnamed protein product [Merluccius merluccius]
MSRLVGLLLSGAAGSRRLAALRAVWTRGSAVLHPVLHPVLRPVLRPVLHPPQPAWGAGSTAAVSGVT